MGTVQRVLYNNVISDYESGAINLYQLEDLVWMLKGYLDKELEKEED